jgi:2,3-bisphosphoglycerate-dependent phosphoglycerate mutase
MPILVVMRHGATRWSQENRFAGWADAALSEKGLEEAHKAAKTLKKAEISFDLCLTSLLSRASRTLDIAARELGIAEEKVKRDWRLNERHYGAHQGETRGAMISRYGNAQVVQWRRAYDEVPPLLEDGDPRWTEQLNRLKQVPLDRQPRAESLRQAAERVAPSWHDVMLPALKAGGNLLVVAHTSALRGLARVIEHLSDEQCEAFRIATAIPRLYVLGDDLRVQEKADLNEGLGSSLRYWGNRLKPRGLGWA